MEQGKSNLVPLALTAVITAIIVGSGVYLWQRNQVVQPKQEAANQSQSELYRNTAYGFAITATKECVDLLKIEQDKKDATIFNVMAPTAKQWPKNTPWYSYSVMSQASYDALPGEEGSGPFDKNPLVAKLKGGFVLLSVPPQDVPDGLGSCELNARVY